ncbi:MAG: rhomboid family intramembrane serine protease [Acidobacteria bacterium]|nr:MAG: rhomboid family intramembrane serine protease [Acidobacteriota bacterium]
MSYSRGAPPGGVSLYLPPVTPMVLRIIVVLSAAFAVQVFLELARLGGVVTWLALTPALVVGRLAVWQLATYALLHGGLWHLLMNLLGLYMFGGDVERVVGSRRLLGLFATSVVGGGLAHAVVALAAGSGYVPVLGASGGVLGVVAAFAALFPQRQVFIFPIPVPIRAWVMALVFAAINLYGAVGANRGGGIAFVAHLGGMLFGYLFLLWTVRGGPGGGSRRSRPRFRVLEGRGNDNLFH